MIGDNQQPVRVSDYNKNMIKSHDRRQSAITKHNLPLAPKGEKIRNKQNGSFTITNVRRKKNCNRGLPWNIQQINWRAGIDRVWDCGLA